MTPLKALVGLVALLFDAFFGKKTGAWPDGEQPLIDEPQLFDDDPFVSDSYLRYNFSSDPMPGCFRGGFEDEVSAGSAIEARVDAPADEVPTPGRAHTPGVGHPKITAGLMIAAAHGLREYTTCGDCEAPTYWSAIADQLDPK